MIPGYWVLRERAVGNRKTEPAAPDGANPSGQDAIAPVAMQPVGPSNGSAVPFEEDCRTLAEFYPDAEERDQLHYTFAHRFFPQYFFANPRGVVRSPDDPDTVDGDTRYIQARWQMMEQHLELVPLPFGPGRMVFRRVMDLHAWRQYVVGRPALFVQLPVPESPVRAFFFAMVLEDAPPDGDEPGGRFITLERTYQDGDEPATERSPGILCEWTADGSHHNSGAPVAPDREAFVRAVEERIGRRDG